jgi:hypothetical protein
MNDAREHYVPDMELSAFFDMVTNVEGDRYTRYMLFIKYDENIYIDTRSAGSIIMPFEELLKNKLLKMYYDLSLLFVKDKKKLFEKSCDDDIIGIYKGRRNYFVECAYILNGEVKTDKNYCYYDINPLQLKDPDFLWQDPYTGERKAVNTSSEIEWFNYNFQVNVGHVLSVIYKKRVIHYTNLALAYNAMLMEKELNEISAIEEDKQNLIKLIAFYKKKGMNGDIFKVIYDNLILATDMFVPCLANLDDDTDRTIRSVIIK